MGDSMKFDEFAGWLRINGSGWELVASMDMKSNSESIRWSSWGRDSRHKRRACTALERDSAVRGAKESRQAVWPVAQAAAAHAPGAMRRHFVHRHVQLRWRSLPL